MVGDKVFVTSDEPMLHCIDAKRGTEIWEVPHVAQFAASSAKRVYGVDDLGVLVVLDAANGAVLGRMPTDSSTYALVNDQTDRVYLVSKDGVVQCFHEIGVKEPMHHRPQVEQAAPPTSEGQPAGPSAATSRPAQPPAKAEDAEKPADEDAAPAEEMDEAAEPAAPAEASEAGSDEDPFSDIPE